MLHVCINRTTEVNDIKQKMKIKTNLFHCLFHRVSSAMFTFENELW